MMSTLIKSIGLYTRYYFFLIAGKKRTLKSLSYEAKDEYKDLGKQIYQGFLNTLIGTIVLFIIVIICLMIVYN